MSDASVRKPCGCPICVVGRAMTMLEAAHDTWVEHGGAEEMDLAYLLDEVETFLGERRWWWGWQRKNLQKAVENVRLSRKAAGVHWQHGTERTRG